MVTELSLGTVTSKTQVGSRTQESQHEVKDGTLSGSLIPNFRIAAPTPSTDSAADDNAGTPVLPNTTGEIVSTVPGKPPLPTVSTQLGSTHKPPIRSRKKLLKD
jgi:hypothetical protein